MLENIPVRQTNHRKGHRLVVCLGPATLGCGSGSGAPSMTVPGPSRSPVRPSPAPYSGGEWRRAEFQEDTNDLRQVGKGRAFAVAWSWELG